MTDHAHPLDLTDAELAAQDDDPGAPPPAAANTPGVLSIGPADLIAARADAKAAKALMERILAFTVEGYDPGGCCLLVVSMPGFQGAST